MHSLVERREVQFLVLGDESGLVRLPLGSFFQHFRRKKAYRA
jgi:hypothetical protein